MGNEQSTIVDENTPPQTLEARTIDGVAQHIKKGHVKRIVVMTGAGISTSAGIPDFRSPDTGLYANLARLNLPYPEAVFDISFFRSNPLPFYALAHELYPGRYRPTVAHCFVTLLHKKNLLLKLFTQNIDCLERTAGVPDDLIVEAHGSFARQHCIECGNSLPDAAMAKAIAERTVPHCANVPTCTGLVKPDIVFFGEQLPASFFESRSLVSDADLCVVMGTSLSVQPFASLPALVPDGVPRVLVNKERVGGLGGRADDVLLLEDCDTGVRRLADALGWREELEALWRETAMEGENGTEGEEKQPAPSAKSKDELLEEEVLKLTADVDRSLQLSGEHTARVRDQLEEKERKNKKDDEKLSATESALLQTSSSQVTAATNSSNAREEKDETTSVVPAPPPPPSIETAESPTRNLPAEGRLHFKRAKLASEPRSRGKEEEDGAAEPESEAEDSAAIEGAGRVSTDGDASTENREQPPSEAKATL